MTKHVNDDQLDPEEYARRIDAGDELLYLSEAANLVRKCIDTLRYYRHLGIGPRSFKHGRYVTYWKTDLIAWLADESTGRTDGAHALARPQVGRSVRRIVSPRSQSDTTSNESPRR